MRSLGIAVSDRHRANGDALATLKLFKLLLAKDTDKRIIREIVRDEAQGELSPRQLDIVEQMPSETGVYYMHNKEGEIIYLGKSRSIKKRVNQHFTNSSEKSRNLQKETKKVTFEKTGSELLRNKPKYNTIKTNFPEHTGDAAPNGLNGYGTDFLIVDKGRETGEHSAILVKKGMFKGLGYYNLNFQLNNLHILESIITPMEDLPGTLQLIGSYLETKKVVKIIDLNKTA